MAKIGVFGGTFDPVHYGHLYIANQAWEQCGLDKVIFMPSNQPPHKTRKDITSYKLRYAWLLAATGDHPGFEVSNLEYRKNLSYTFDTLAALEAEFPEDEFFFIMGADMLSDFPSWYRAAELIAKNKLIVLGRPGEKSPQEIVEQSEFLHKYSDRIQIVEAVLMDISSTALRNMRAEGRSLRYLVPESVRQMMYQDVKGIQ